ncbi:ADP-ribosylglycohydrolase family protein [Oscillospiraceae bacterium PP1C4]
MMIPDNYIEKTYAGWLGKVIGIRLGAPIEGWSKEKIRLMVGDKIEDYIVDYQDFAADDDSNGPIYFTRALEHYKKLTPREFGYTFLNFIPKEHGFFWWGGELSTEHTAYHNLLRGIEAPQSGSAEKNGKELAEQIGGQIFIDGFGFAAPAKPALAAALAESCARVTHDLNGVAGARFVAACISLAYVRTSLPELMREALTYIEKGDYYQVVSHMLQCRQEEKTWEEAFSVLREHYWTDHYPGICHIIPNAGILALALAYGDGNYTKTLEIVNLCGFDTDCNAGNAGAIVGVFSGIAANGTDNGIPKKLITPIRDIVLASGITGSLNISTISDHTLQFCKAGYELAEEEMPQPYLGYWKELAEGQLRRAHFEFPHAIHGFRIRGGYKDAETAISHSTETACSGKASLKITVNNLHCADSVFVYQKTYYSPEDLHDARYQPAFSPIAYPADEVCCCLNNVTGQKLKAYLYCYDLYSKEKIRFAEENLYGEEYTDWCCIKGKIPYRTNALIKEIGVELVSDEREDTYFGEQVCVFLDEFTVKAASNYQMDFAQIPVEDYSLHTAKQTELSGFTHYRPDFYGLKLSKNGLMLSQGEKIFTGDYYWRNYQYQVKFVFLSGEQADFVFRSQGILRSYYLRITKNSLAVLAQFENTEYQLAKADFSLEYGKEYTVLLTIQDDCFSATVDGHTIQAVDTANRYPYGAVGMQVDSESAILLMSYSVQAIEE